MGPNDSWSEEELRKFFDLLKKYHQKFDVIAQHLPGRTPSSIQLLYEQHKTVLSLNITVDVFLACIADKSQSSHKQSVDVHVEGIKSPSRTKKKRDIDEANFHGSPKTPIAKRKKDSFSLIEIGNENRSPNEDDHLTEIAAELLTLKESGRDTPKNDVKNYMYINDYKEKESKPVLLKLDFSKQIQENLTKVLSNEKFRKWCTYEWFYPDMDQLWYGENEFQGCLNAILQHNKKTGTRKEWNCIRSMMGPPRRLSKAFLDSERNKLKKHRMNTRLCRENKATLDRDYRFTQKKAIETIINPGEKCLFLANNFEVNVGTVKQRCLSVYEVEYEDMRGEKKLVKVDDDLIMSFNNTAKSNRKLEVASPNRVLITPYKKKRTTEDMVGSKLIFNDDQERIYTEDDKHLIISMTQLLKDKTHLISVLRHMHDQAAEMKENGTEYPEDFRKEYASIILALDSLNNSISDIMEKNSKRQEEIENLYPQLKQSHMPYNWYSEMNNDCTSISNTIMNAINIEEQDKENLQAALMMIQNCISLCVHIIQCKELSISFEQMSVALDAAIAQIKPLFENNQMLYHKIDDCIKIIKRELLQPESLNK